jgi:transposase InsO family protein
LAACLGRQYPRQVVPCARTIGKWLKRMKLSRCGPRRRPHGPYLIRSALTVPKHSNQVWTVDFKGWFRTQDGQRVEPLTVRDLFSRFLLGVVLLPDQSWRPTRRVFMRLFGQHGYPQIIRLDNGGPFGSSGPAGLSRLSAWWTALGIRVQFIAPGHPEQNGAHEQMHRVFKAETTRPSSRHLRAQQRRTNRWVKVYNQLRPHEALGQRPPAEVYRAKPLLKKRNISLKYPMGMVVRRVRSNGEIRWRGHKRFLGEAFVGYTVGLKLLNQGKYAIYFAGLLIGELWERDQGRIRPARYARRF